MKRISALGLSGFAFMSVLVLLAVLSPSNFVLGAIDAVTTFPANLSFRRNTLLVNSGTRPAWAGSYTVQALKPGAYVTSNSSGTTITVRQGHGFAAGDKLIDGVDLSKYRTVSAVTATTLTISASLQVFATEILCNLGADTGGVTPNYDTPGTSIYSEPSGTLGITASRVSADAVGVYSYWHNTPELWELVRDSLGVPVRVIPLATTTPGIRPVTWDFLGVGTKGPLWNFPLTNDGAASMERLYVGRDPGWPYNGISRFNVEATFAQSMSRAKIDRTQVSLFGTRIESEFRGNSAVDVTGDSTIDADALTQYGLYVDTINRWVLGNPQASTLAGTYGILAENEYQIGTGANQSNEDLYGVAGSTYVGNQADMDGDNTFGEEVVGRVRDVYGVAGLATTYSPSDTRNLYGGFFRAIHSRTAAAGASTAFRGTAYGLSAQYANFSSMAETLPSAVGIRNPSPAVGAGAITRYSGLLIDDISGPTNYRAAYIGGGLHMRAASPIIFNGAMGTYPADNTGDGQGGATYDQSSGLFGLQWNSGASRLDYTGANFSIGTVALGDATFTFNVLATPPKILADASETALTVQNAAWVLNSCSATAGAATITVDGCNMVTLTGTTAITTINTCGTAQKGRILYILCGSATGAFFVDANMINVKLSANLTCSGDDSLTLLCDGSSWIEIARSVN